MKFKSKLWLFLKLYLLVFTAVGFGMFVCEEAMQVSTFACFSYSKINDYQGLEEHLDSVVKPLASFSEGFINNVGWLNPVMYLPYSKYAESNRAYIKSQEALIRDNRVKAVTTGDRIYNLEELVYGEPNKDDVVMFGMHKGKLVRDVPDEYFEWGESMLD